MKRSRWWWFVARVAMALVLGPRDAQCGMALANGDLADDEELDEGTGLLVG